MAKVVKSAAVYARISSDDGQALGVKRQLEDCRKLAASLGWAVGDEYVDYADLRIMPTCGREPLILSGSGPARSA